MKTPGTKPDDFMCAWTLLASLRVRRCRQRFMRAEYVAAAGGERTRSSVSIACFKRFCWQRTSIASLNLLSLSEWFVGSSLF